MATLAEVRSALATAVSGAGIECLEYGPDAPAAPLAWIDDVGLDFSGGSVPGTFCLPATATATVVAIAQRHDRAGSVQLLEEWISPAIDALTNLPGVRVLTATEGQLSTGGQELPSVLLTVQFLI